MSTVHKSDTDQKQFWQMVLDTFTSSGLSVRRFCKQEGLSEPSFYSWRKKLTLPQPSAIEKQKGQPDPFIQVSVPHEKFGNLELVLASGHTLRIGPGVNRTALSGLISVLQEANLC